MATNCSKLISPSKKYCIIHIPELIRLRELVGYSQEQFAAKIELTQQRLSQIESEVVREKEIYTEVAEKIISVLQQNPEKPIQNLIELRATKAQKKLDKWQSKFKRIGKLIKKYQRQVKYYEHKMAAQPST